MGSGALGSRAGLSSARRRPRRQAAGSAGPRAEEAEGEAAGKGAPSPAPAPRRPRSAFFFWRFASHVPWTSAAGFSGLRLSARRQLTTSSRRPRERPLGGWAVGGVPRRAHCLSWPRCHALPLPVAVRPAWWHQGWDNSSRTRDALAPASGRWRRHSLYSAWFRDETFVAPVRPNRGETPRGIFRPSPTLDVAPRHGVHRSDLAWLEFCLYLYFMNV